MVPELITIRVGEKKLSLLFEQQNFPESIKTSLDVLRMVYDAALSADDSQEFAVEIQPIQEVAE